MTDKNTADPVVEVYWRPGCPYCWMLLRPLRRSGLRLREVNIWDDPEAAARVRSVANGNETVPTVFIGDRALVNPTVRQVLTLAGKQASVSWWKVAVAMLRPTRPPTGSQAG